MVSSSFKISPKMIQNCVSVGPHHSLHWLVCPAVWGAQIGPCPALLGPARFQGVHHQEKSVFWAAEGSYAAIFPGHGQDHPVSAGSKTASHLGSAHTGGPTSEEKQNIGEDFRTTQETMLLTGHTVRPKHTHICTRHLEYNLNKSKWQINTGLKIV